MQTERTAAYNSTYPKGGVSCSKDSFVVNQTLVFQIKFCGKSPALRVAAKRSPQFAPLIEVNDRELSEAVREANSGEQRVKRNIEILRLALGRCA